MADNIVLSAGTADGATLATDEVTRATVLQQVQYVKLMNGTDAAIDVIPGEATNGLDVDVTRLPALVAGSATIGAVNLAEYTPSSGRLPIELDAAALAALETITVASISAAIPAGTNNIGDVDVASIAAGDNNIGNVDVVTLPATALAAGNLVHVDYDSGAGTQNMPMVGMALPASGGSVAGGTSTNPIRTDPTGTTTQPVSGTVELGATSLAALETITVAQVTAAIPAGTNNIGDVDVLTLPGSAHDAAISGNPVRIAGRAMTANYTSVASGDTADLVCTLNGHQVVQPYAIPENTWSYAAASGGIVNTTGVTAKAAAGAGIRIYVTHVDVVNGHATVSTDVQIRDGAAGTVKWRGFAQAAGGGVSANFDPPLQLTANTLCEIACGTTGTATYFNLTGYTGP